MTPEEALRHEWILDGLPIEILIHHQKLHNITNNELPVSIRKKLDRFIRKANKSKKDHSLSSKSNSTNKDYSIPRKSIISSSLTRKKKGHGFSPKSNCELSKSKNSNNGRKSLSKSKKAKGKPKRKHRFIRRAGFRKAPNVDGAVSNQTATMEESSEEGSRPREISLPNNKKSSDLAVFPNQIIPHFGKVK